LVLARSQAERPEAKGFGSAAGTAGVSDRRATPDVVRFVGGDFFFVLQRQAKIVEAIPQIVAGEFVDLVIMGAYGLIPWPRRFGRGLALKTND
jgi:hypothetical protein